MSEAAKGHVPEENLDRYRPLARLARRFKSLGDDLSNVGYYGYAHEAWSDAEFFWQEANKLRVDLPTK